MRTEAVTTLPFWAKPITSPQPCECGKAAVAWYEVSVILNGEKIGETGTSGKSYLPRTSTQRIFVCSACLAVEQYFRAEGEYRDAGHPLSKGDTDFDLELLLEDATLLAIAESNVPARWTEDEIAFLRDNTSYMTPDEMAAALGRSRTAVLMARKRFQIPAARHMAGWMSLDAISRLFQIDRHSVLMWADRGYLSARYIAGDAGIRMASDRAIKQFAVNPNHWMMFKVDRIQDETLFSLVIRRMERWNDEWWRPSQVAEYHGLSDEAMVNSAIHARELHGVRWGNWWIRKSVAIAHTFSRERGWWSHHAKPTADAHAFTVLADAAGVHSIGLERMLNTGAMRKVGRSADHRLRVLRENGQYATIAESLQGVCFDEETGEAWAPWQLNAHRFPGWVRRLRAWRDGKNLDQEGRTMVRHLLRHWGRWFAETEEELDLAHYLRLGSVGGAVSLENAYVRFLEVFDMDPLAERAPRRRRGRPRKVL